MSHHDPDRVPLAVAVPILAVAFGLLAMLAYMAAPLLAPYLPNGRAALSKEGVYNDPLTPTVAAPNSDVTIVMFSDYQCPICRTTHPDLNRVRHEDGRIRMVYKDWPLLGDASVRAAKVAIAANWQGKYEAVHDALMRTKGRLDERKIRAAAMRGGVDWMRLERDLRTRNGEIEALLERNRLQAEAIGFNGTPSFLIGSYLVPGSLDAAGLRKAIAMARQKPPKKSVNGDPPSRNESAMR